MTRNDFIQKIVAECSEMQIGEEKSFTIPQEVNANLLATETSGTLSNVHAGSFAAHRNGYKIKISKFVNK